MRLRWCYQVTDNQTGFWLFLWGYLQPPIAWWLGVLKIKWLVVRFAGINWFDMWIICFLVYLGLTSLTTLSLSVMVVSKRYNSAILNVHVVISSQDCPCCQESSVCRKLKWSTSMSTGHPPTVYELMSLFFLRTVQNLWITVWRTNEKWLNVKSWWYVK